MFEVTEPSYTLPGHQAMTARLHSQATAKLQIFPPKKGAYRKEQLQVANYSEIPKVNPTQTVRLYHCQR